MVIESYLDEFRSIWSVFGLYLMLLSVEGVSRIIVHGRVQRAPTRVKNLFSKPRKEC
jgi:hypothetical protein